MIIFIEKYLLALSTFICFLSTAIYENSKTTSSKLVEPVNLYSEFMKYIYCWYVSTIKIYMFHINEG